MCKNLLEETFFVTLNCTEGFHHVISMYAYVDYIVL
jgi:hypothetical protein